MAKYEVDLTDTEDIALSYASVTQQAWIDNVVHNRCRIATDEIVGIYTKRALDEGVQIPTTREKIVTDAFTRGWVKTAQQRNEEASTPLASQTEENE